MLYPLTEQLQNNQEDNVLLTDQQITYATEHFIYHEEGSENNTCPISLEEFSEGDILIKIRGCRHVFKSTNLLRWFNRNVRCPVCRHDLRTYSRDASANEIPQGTNTQIEPTLDNNNREEPITPPLYNDISRMIFENLMPNITNSETSFDEPANLMYTFEFPVSRNLDVD